MYLLLRSFAACVHVLNTHDVYRGCLRLCVICVKVLHTGFECVLKLCTDFVCILVFAYRCHLQTGVIGILRLLLNIHCSYVFLHTGIVCVT